MQSGVRPTPIEKDGYVSTVLITGANRGIGLEFARQYAADGWNVIATARHSSTELDQLGVRVESLDLADAEAVAAFPAKIAGPLDLLIANAGAYGRAMASSYNLRQPPEELILGA